MPIFTWNEMYSVQVKQCDVQHMKLFDIVNELADAMREGKGSTVLRKTLGDLLQYTRVHFAQEEELMQRSSYPKIAGHKEQHRKFIADIEKFNRELESSGIGNSVAVLSVLKDWLVDHIQKTDKAYSAHLNASGIR
jgi:hemerythrin